ncbi:cupin domain-containing protein [Massilia putida]|uniref:cupin domain-containing protein n=1 Tax=Massilia putida TaxID=1141883 RepID=UPI000950FFF8|nr:cupin domain-containing protein [Massilia putida]
MKRMMSCACLVLLAAVSFPAGARGSQETVKPLFHRALPNVPGKALVAVEVTFPPGASAPPHTHPRSAFIYAQVLSGAIVSAVDDAPPRAYRTGEGWYEDPGARHRVTRNASKDKPARLLAVFVLDEGEQPLVLPQAR